MLIEKYISLGNTLYTAMTSCNNIIRQNPYKILLEIGVFGKYMKLIDVVFFSHISPYAEYFKLMVL